MAKPDFIIQLHDWSNPIQNSITLKHVKIFYKMLLKTNSDFYKYTDKNANSIKYEKINLTSLQTYFDFDIDEIIDQFDKPNVLLSNKKIKEPTLIGGSDAAHTAILLLSSIVGYIYGDLFLLDLYKNPQFGGTHKQNPIINYNYNDEHVVNVVFVISVNMSNLFYLKISAISESAEHEQYIYNQLNKVTDTNVRKLLVLPVSTGEINAINPNLNFSHQNFSHNIIFEKSFRENLAQFGRTHGVTNFKYILTPYNNNYVTLSSLLYKYPAKFTQEQYKIFIDGVIALLAKLSDLIGFHHIDLHAKNILIHQDNLQFKLFDFDLSETTQTLANRNGKLEIESRMDEVDIPIKVNFQNVNNIHNTLLIYDCYRLLYNFYCHKSTKNLLNTNSHTKIFYDVFDKYNADTTNALTKKFVNEVYAKNGKLFGEFMLQIMAVKKEFNDDIINLLRKNSIDNYDKEYNNYALKVTTKKLLIDVDVDYFDKPTQTQQEIPDLTASLLVIPQKKKPNYDYDYFNDSPPESNLSKAFIFNYNDNFDGSDDDVEVIKKQSGGKYYSKYLKYKKKYIQTKKN